jgi:hypothetical protein
MTFAVLRALHAILGDALTDIEAVYAAADPPPTHKKANSFSRVYASPPPSPSSYSASAPPNSDSALDFPSLDAPYDPASAAEQLTVHPTVVAAINRIVAAAGQMAATVQVPFLTLCDAAMGYHLPSCLRVLEAAHVVELLRDGPVHVREIAARTGVEQAKLGGALFLFTAFSFVNLLLDAAHILRLLATHHILREAAPDVFAANRISSLIDSGKPLRELVAKYVVSLLSPSFSFFFRYFLSFSRAMSHKFLYLSPHFTSPSLAMHHILREATPPTASARSSTREKPCATSSQSTVANRVSALSFPSPSLSFFVIFFLSRTIFYCLCLPSPLPVSPPPSPPRPSSTSASVTRHFSCGTRRSH